jgi:anti-anti-sigma regulatory factor
MPTGIAPPRKIGRGPPLIERGKGIGNQAVEIAISKMGDLRILSVKGSLRLQHWRVIDKHLDALLEHGADWVALDLSGASLGDDAALESLSHNARKFQARRAHLLIQSGSASLREALRSAFAGIDPNDVIFADRPSLEAGLRGRVPLAPIGKLN